MNGVLIRNWILIIIVFSKLLSFGQFKNFENLNSKINIPSTETYQVYQDKAGFVWLATDAGACRYDGNDLEIFDENKGLTDNTILGFYEDYKNRIWLRTYNNKICYYSNKKIYTLPEKTYNRILEITEGTIITSMYLDNGDTLWLGLTSGPGYLKVYNNFSIVKTVSLDPKTMYVVNVDHKGCIYGKTEGIDLPWKLTIYRKSKIIITSPVPVNIRNDYKFFHCYQRLGKTSFLFSYKNILFIYANNKVACKEFESEILSIYLTDSMNCELNTLNRKVIHYNFVSGDVTTDEVAETITSKTKDNEGGIWYSTLNNGIFYAPTLYHEKMIKNSVIKENTILDFTTTPTHLVYINKSNIITFKNRHNGTQKQFECKTELYCLKRINDNLFFCGGYESFFIDTTGKKTYVYSEKTKIPINIMFTDDIINNQFLCTGRTEIYSINSLTQKATLLSRSTYRIRDAKIDPEGTILIATIKGMLVLKKQGLIPYFDTSFLANKRIENFSFDKDHNLWMCLKKMGLYKYDVKTKHISHINRIDADVYRNTYIDETNIVWLSSNNGIFKIIPAGAKYHIYHYDKIDGLNSIDVKKIIVKNNEIFALTNSDLFVIDPKMLTSKNECIKDLLITVSSNTTTLNDKNLIELDYGSPISISIKALTFKYQDKMVFLYSISDKPGAYWSPVNGKTLLFPALKWGNYTINIKALNTKNNTISKLKTIRLHIKTPYYYSWPFLTIAFLLFMLAIYCIYTYNIIKQKKELIKKNSIETKISRLKLQAIKAQMNPHFISNTISSIQYYIMQNDIEKSFEYLSNFSGLIRMVFEMSFDEFIFLKEELNMLKLYINLEQMRFDEPFEYDLQVDPDVAEKNPKLPTMLLQPYIENAIIHGLMPKKQQTKLSLIITKSNTDLIIKIIDNGIGRQKSAELNKKKTNKSKGITLTLEKVRILNQHTNLKTTVVINDLKKMEEPVGTEVVITIFNLLT